MQGFDFEISKSQGTIICIRWSFLKKRVCKKSNIRENYLWNPRNEKYFKFKVEAH